MSALCGAGDIDGYIVDIVGVVLRDETCVKAQVVRGVTPIVRVLSGAVCATVVL
jgi:hypothetical protein